MTFKQNKEATYPRHEPDFGAEPWGVTNTPNMVDINNEVTKIEYRETIFLGKRAPKSY